MISRSGVDYFRHHGAVLGVYIGAMILLAQPMLGIKSVRARVVRADRQIQNNVEGIRAPACAQAKI